VNLVDNIARLGLTVDRLLPPARTDRAMADLNQAAAAPTRERREDMAQLTVPVDSARFSKGMTWKDYMAPDGRDPERTRTTTTRPR